MDIANSIEKLLTIDLDKKSFEESIITHKDFISEFAAQCRELSSFNRYPALYRYLKKRFKDNEDRISLIFVQYLEKVTRAKSDNVLISVTILFVPLLDDAIKEKYGK